MRFRLKQVAADPTGTTGLADLVMGKGDLMVASTTGTLVRIPVGADDEVLTADSTATAGVAWAPAASGGGGGGLLAYTRYQPSSLNSYALASSTPVAVDTTNVKVTFTAPVSGAVLIRASAYVVPPSGSSLRMCLISSGSVVAGTRQIVTGGPVPARCHYAIVVTGLTSGASYTYALGWFANAGANMYVGEDGSNSSYGPILLEAWSA